MPGVIVAAVGWQLLQHLGGFYVDHILKRTGPLYGVFALVLGLLAWLSLGAQIVVSQPRSTSSKPDACGRGASSRTLCWMRTGSALTSSAEVEERVEEENVEVSFEDTPRLTAPPADAALARSPQHPPTLPAGLLPETP